MDAPLYRQMNQLFAFSAEAYSQFRVIQDKVSLFNSWCESFNKKQKERIQGVVTQEYDKIRNSIPGFVERHLEDDDVNDAWKTHCDQFNTQDNIERSVNLVKEKLEEKNQRYLL